LTQSPVLGERVAALVPPIPNYVWLAMLLLAATLLGVSTMLRARGQLTTAQNNYAVSDSRLTQALAANSEIKDKTALIRTNARAAAQAAQEQLHYVKPNEIVIATR
jgi:cell division protein FtsB